MSGMAAQLGTIDVSCRNGTYLPSELRLRDYLTLRLGAMVFAAAGVQVVIVAFLLTQFLPN